MNSSLTPDLSRVIDANLNRLKEGIRVVEDILRYCHNDKTISKQLKSLRHKVITDNTKELLLYRDSINDVLRPSLNSELQRVSECSIVIANFKRIQESARVLEELYKLTNVTKSELFKSVRYEIYTIEKEVVLKYYP